MGRWRFVVGTFLLLALGVPLVLPFVQLLAEPAALQVWSEGARLLLLARNTALLVVGTLVLALPMGVIGALLLYRSDLPFRGFLRFLTVLTLFVPLPVFATGWQAALGSGGLIPVTRWTSPQPPDKADLPEGAILWKPWAQGIGTAIWIHAVAGLPWVVWLVGRGLSWVERELEEDALLLAGPWWVVWHVTLRRSRAAITVAALWVALQTATEVTVTDMMQVRTFAEEVYTQFVRGDHALLPRVVAVALPSVALTALLAWWAARRWECSLPPLTTLAGPPRVFPLGRLRWPCLALVLPIVGLLTVVPLASLVWKAGLGGSPEAWSVQTVSHSLARAWSGQRTLILESLALAATAGALAGALGLLTCWLALGAPRFRLVALGLMVLAWALPGPVLGIGLKDTINLLLPAPDYAKDLSGLPMSDSPPKGTISQLLSIVAHPLAVALYYGPSPLPNVWINLIRFFPYAVAVLWPVVRLLPAELRDTARVDGLGPGRELRHVVLPLTLPAVLRASLAAGVLSLGELGAGKLVETPGSRTFTHTLFEQMHYGTGSSVASLCLLLLAAVVVGGALVAVTGRFVPKGWHLET